MATTKPTISVALVRANVGDAMTITGLPAVAVIIFGTPKTRFHRKTHTPFFSFASLILSVIRHIIAHYRATIK